MRQPAPAPSLQCTFSRLAISLVLITVFTGCSSLTLNDVLGAPTGGPTNNDAPLSRETITSGLREALRVGSERSVGRTSRVDGFLANELIRINIPREYEDAAATLRKVGFGRQVDELEIGMNRAAEEAASEARAIFWDAISTITFSDATAILRGHQTAATDYLQTRTTDRIRTRFQPIVARKIDEVGLGRLYAQLSERYNRLPFVTQPALNLDDYVTDEAVSGLFTVLAEEERKIREDPLARTTELLRRVFGSRR